MTINIEELYQKAEELKISLNEISVYNMDVYSAIELYYSIASTVRKIIQELGIQNDKLIYLLDKGLPEELNKILDKFKEDGTLENIINNNIFDNLNNQISEISSLLNQEIKTIKNEINSVGYNMATGNLDCESDTIVKRGFLSLSNTQTWSYYDSNLYPEIYPSCELNKEGELVFSGQGKVFADDFLKIPKVENMLHIATLFHIDISGYEGIPLWTYIIGINDEDYNDSILLPVKINTDGKILVKNVGEPKYYTRLDFSSMRVKLNNHRCDLITEEVSNKIKKVYEKGNTKNLVFFTDLHHNFTDKVTPFYRRNITLKMLQLTDNLLNPICFISGGDNIVDTPFRNETIACHKEVLSSFRKDKYIHANGNHDVSILEDRSQYIKPSDIKPFFNNSKTVFAGEEKYYGFTDYEKEKLRVISIDSSEVDYNSSDIAGQVGTFISNEQLNWIKTNAMNMQGKSDWNVIIVMHMLPIDPIANGDTAVPNALTIRQLFEDFKYGSGDFSSQGKIKLCCVLGGHEHRDEIKQINGITYFRSLLSWECDYQYTINGVNTYVPRRRGNKTEIVFNILSIDDINRKLYITRVGQSYTLDSEIINF